MWTLFGAISGSNIDLNSFTQSTSQYKANRISWTGWIPVSSLTNACSQVHGRKWLGCHAGWQEVDRCRTRGESHGMCNTYVSSPPSTNKTAQSDFETQRRRHRKSKTGVSVAPLKKDFWPQKNIFKNTYLLRLQILNKLRYENPEITHYVLLETACLFKSSVKSISYLFLIFYHILSNLPHRFHRPSNLTKVKAKSRHFKHTLFFSFFFRMLLDYNEIKTYRKTVNDLKWFLYFIVLQC